MKKAIFAIVFVCLMAGIQAHASSPLVNPNRLAQKNPPT